MFMIYCKSTKNTFSFNTIQSMNCKFNMIKRVLFNIMSIKKDLFSTKTHIFYKVSERVQI